MFTLRIPDYYKGKTKKKKIVRNAKTEEQVKSEKLTAEVHVVSQAMDAMNL